MDQQKPQTREVTPPAGKPRRWYDSWPVLIPLVLIGGLLWVTQWFQTRQKFIEAFPEVKFRPPRLMGRFDLSDATLKLIGEPRTLAIGGQSFDHFAPFLDHFQKVERLYAWEMTDAQVRQLPALSAIESCKFRGCSLSNDGCDAISEWTSLLSLEIHDNPDQYPGYRVTITTEGIRKLTTLDRLRELKLNCPELDTAVFAVIGDFAALEQLDIYGLRVDRVGLQGLARAPALEHLRLRGCVIDNSALDGLAECDRLVSLDLSSSAVTDEMIPSLARISLLKTLDLTGTYVSRAACQALLEQRPELNIEDANGNPVSKEAVDE